MENGPGPQTDENEAPDNAETATTAPDAETETETEAPPVLDLAAENAALKAENADLQNALNEATTRNAALRESAAIAAASPGGVAPAPVGRQTFLYRTDCIGGQVFTGDAAIEAALEDGWKESPAECEPPPTPSGNQIRT